jgi:hypothetical protein
VTPRRRARRRNPSVVGDVVEGAAIATVAAIVVPVAVFALALLVLSNKGTGF